MEAVRNRPSIFSMNEKVLKEQADKITAEGGGNTGGQPTTMAPVTTIAPGSPAGAGASPNNPNPGKPGETTFAPSQNNNHQPTTTQAPAGTQNQSTTAKPDDLDDDAILLARLRKKYNNPELTLEDYEKGITRKAEPTPEEKERQDQEKELQLLAAFQRAGKGTIDDFYRIRNIKTMADDAVVRNEFAVQAKKEIPDITDDEIEELFNKQYFIGEDGTYSEKELKLGKKRLAADAKAIREAEAMPLSEIEKNLEYDAEAVISKRAWDKDVNQFVTTLPKSITIPIGKVGEADLGDFTYNLVEEQQGKIAESLKDPAFLLKSITDEKKPGKTDLSKLANLVQRNLLLEGMVRAAASEFYSKGLDSIASKLENRPDLRGNTTDTSTELQEIEKGRQQIQKDSQQLLGRRNKVKSFSS